MKNTLLSLFLLLALQFISCGDMYNDLYDNIDTNRYRLSVCANSFTNVNLYHFGSDGKLAQSPWSHTGGITLMKTMFSDFNGDGHTDIFILDQTAGQFNYIYTSDGKGNFLNYASIQNVSGNNFNDAVCADFDRNGLTDIIIANITAGLFFPNYGNASFSPVTLFSVPGYDYNHIEKGDFDNDGYDDIAVGSGSGFNTIIFLNRLNTTGNFIQTSFTGSTGIPGLAAADFSGDSVPDLAEIVFITPNNYVRFYINDGHGNFSHAFDVKLDGGSISSICSADLNGDGRMDLFITTSGTYSFAIISENGGGYIVNEINNGGAAANTCAAGDVDLDGDVDIVTGRGPVIIVLTNDGRGNLVKMTDSFSPGYIPYGVSLGAVFR